MLREASDRKTSRGESMEGLHKARKGVVYARYIITAHLRLPRGNSPPVMALNYGPKLCRPTTADPEPKLPVCPCSL